MEDKNQNLPQDQSSNLSSQSPRPPGGKIIQPTEDIIKELSAEKDADTSPEPVHQATSSAQSQVAPAAVPEPEPMPETIPHIHAVPYSEAAQAVDSDAMSVPPRESTPANDVPAFSFADVSIIQLIKIAGITALFFMALVWVQTRVVGGHITINGRIDSFLTFYPYLLTIGSLLVLTASAALSATLLKKQYYSLGWPRAVTVIMPGIILVGTLYVNWLTFAFLIFISFSSQGTLPNWYNTYTYPLTFIVSTALLAVASIASLFILRVTEKRRHLGLICCALLAVFFIGLVYLVRDVVAHHAESSNVGETTSQNTQDNHSTATDPGSNSNTDTEFSGLDFSVYVPSYMPAGYQLQNNPDSRSIEKPTFYPARGTAPPHFDFTYVSNNGAAVIAVDSFPDSSLYSPPQSCGVDSFDRQAGACQLIGHASIGCDVYYKDFGDYRDYFCKLKDDVISISEYGGQKAVNNAATPSQAEVMKIYNSLQVVSKKDLASKYGAITSRF